MSGASSKKLTANGKQLKADLGGPARVILAAFGIFIISQFVAAFLVQAGLHFTRANQSIDQSAAAQFLYILLAEGAAIGSIYWILKRRGLTLTAIGIGRKLAWRDFKWAAA